MKTLQHTECLSARYLSYAQECLSNSDLDRLVRSGNKLNLNTTEPLRSSYLPEEAAWFVCETFRNHPEEGAQAPVTVILEAAAEKRGTWPSRGVVMAIPGTLDATGSLYSTVCDLPVLKRKYLDEYTTGDLSIGSMEDLHSFLLCHEQFKLKTWQDCLPVA